MLIFPLSGMFLSSFVHFIANFIDMSISEIRMLLEKESSLFIENKISKELGVSIYKENLDKLFGFMQSEVDCSGYTISEIEKCISLHKDLIVSIAVRFLEDESIRQLSYGISITYAIYYLYLSSNPDELKDYLTRRRIPDAKKVVHKLLKIKNELQI